MNTSDLDAIEARYATAACEVGDSDAWRSALDVPDLVAHIRALHAAVRRVAASQRAFDAAPDSYARAKADAECDAAMLALFALVPEVTP